MCSQWHRNNPDLVGTESDPWMVHESYRKTVPAPQGCDKQTEDSYPSKERLDGFQEGVAAVVGALREMDWRKGWEEAADFIEERFKLAEKR